MSQFRFRWKYAFSAFLVCGVLSLTIGGPKAPDPLLLETQRLGKLVEDTFKLNQEGPPERTFLETSPVLVSLVAKVKILGAKISAESFRRGLDHRNEVSGDVIHAVAESAKLYAEMQVRLYRNYMRLAHDARTAAGARKFSPDHYDFLNIKLDTQTAQNLFSDPNANRAYNLRHVKGREGRFEEVELFMNSFEKQMAEYEAISNPNSKEEYLKLIQFAALREGMANRWAIRRMAGAPIRAVKQTSGFYNQTEKLPKLGVKSGNLAVKLFERDRQYGPITFTDQELLSCAADLVSFRLPKKGTVNDIEAYAAPWQADRHTDLLELASDAAVASTVGKSLLSDPEYGELFAIYVSDFQSFIQGPLRSYAGDTKTMLADITEGFAPPIRGGEESKWSRDRIQGHENDIQAGADSLVLAREAFFYSNLPADDLSIKAVAERYADRAFQMRKLYLAEALWAVARLKQSTIEVGQMTPNEEPGASSTRTIQTFPETNRAEARQRAAKVVEDYLRTREKPWKASLVPQIVTAIESKLGMSIPTANGNPAGLGYLFGQDQKRYDAYSKDLMPIAALGARGVRARRAGEEAEKKLTAALKALYHCPPAMAGGGIMGTGAITPACYYRFPEAKDAKDPGEYLGYAPYRNLARERGMTDIILPESPDQLSIFFRKKLELVATAENRATKYVEPEIAVRIGKNAVVLHGLDRLFGALAGAMENGPSGGDDAAVGKCDPVLAGAARPKVRRKARKSASGSALTPEQCSSPENAEVTAKRDQFEAVIIPTARRAYAEFIHGLSDPGTYIDPMRAARKLEQNRKESAKIVADADRKLPRLAQDNLSVRKITPGIMDRMELDQKEVARAQLEAAAERKKRREEDKLMNGYFRVGRDHSLDKKGGELFLATEKERKEAKQLYREALAMLGIAEEVTNGVRGEEAHWGFKKAGNKSPPQQVASFVTTEHLIHQKLAKTRLLERMVATVTDQIAMGKVLAQESIARAPILTLQSNWKWKKDEKQDPILLEKLSAIYSPTQQWGDGAGYHALLKRTLSEAALNDRGKVETFCKADIKSYRNDDDFRTAFMAMTGVRGMLSSDEKLKGWDERIQKESRTWGQSIMEDYIDPNQVLIMIAIGVVVIAQVAFTVGTGGAGVVTAPAAAAQVAALSGLSGTAAAAATVTVELIARKVVTAIAKFIFLQFTGNLGVISLVFSFQSYLMVSTYHFKMPPQMGFTYQLANSRIQNMEKGRFAGVSSVDRERMNQARQELTGQQFAATLAAVGEIAQFGIFTSPGVLRTFGLSGQKAFARMAASSTSKEIDAVGTKSLRGLIKEKGFSDGVSEYWKKAGVAVRSMERVAVVKGKNSAKEGLEVMLGNRLANELLKDRATLKKFYQMMRKEKIAEAKLLMGFAETSLTGFHAIQQEIDALVGPLARKALAEGRDEALVIVWKQDYEKQLLHQMKSAKGEELSKLGWSQRRIETAALAKAAKAQTALTDAAILERYLENLEKTVPVSGESGTAAFIRSWSPSDFEMHRTFFDKKYFVFEKNTYGLFDKATRKGIRKAYKDFNYLTEDWNRAKNARAQAIGRLYREGAIPAYINSESGEFDKIYLKDFDESPEEYVITTLRIPAR